MCLGGWGTGCSWEEESRPGHSHWTFNRETQAITWEVGLRNLLRYPGAELKMQGQAQGQALRTEGSLA